MSASQYTPRRASLKRWLEGAPDYILDVMDSKCDGERYTVMFTGALLSSDGTYSGTFIPYLSLSASLYVARRGKMSASGCAAYRYRAKHQRIRWLDLPENARALIVSHAEQD